VQKSDHKTAKTTHYTPPLPESCTQAAVAAAAAAGLFQRPHTAPAATAAALRACEQ